MDFTWHWFVVSREYGNASNEAPDIDLVVLSRRSATGLRDKAQVTVAFISSVAAVSSPYPR